MIVKYFAASDAWKSLLILTIVSFKKTLHDSLSGEGKYEYLKTAEAGKIKYREES